MATANWYSLYHTLMGATEGYINHQKRLSRKSKKEESESSSARVKDKVPGLKNNADLGSKINDLHHQQYKLNKEMEAAYDDKYKKFLSRAEAHFGSAGARLIQKDLMNLVNYLDAVGIPENIERKIKRMNLLNFGIFWLAGATGFGHLADDEFIVKVNRAIYDIESKLQESQSSSANIRDKMASFIKQEFSPKKAEVYESISNADIFDPILKVKRLILNVFGGRKRIKAIGKDIGQNVKKTAEQNKMQIATALVGLVTTGKIDEKKLIQPWKQMGSSMYKKYETDLKNLAGTASNAVPEELRKYCSVEEANQMISNLGTNLTSNFFNIKNYSFIY